MGELNSEVSIAEKVLLKVVKNVDFFLIEVVRIYFAFIVADFRTVNLVGEVENFLILPEGKEGICRIIFY